MLLWVQGGEAESRLLALMVYPADPDARRLDLACHLLDEHGRSPELVDILMEHDLPAIRAARRTRERRGQVAAALLLRIASLAEREPRKASIGKAARW